MLRRTSCTRRKFVTELGQRCARSLGSWFSNGDDVQISFANWTPYGRFRKGNGSCQVCFRSHGECHEGLEEVAIQTEKEYRAPTLPNERRENGSGQGCERQKKKINPLRKMLR